MALPGRCPAGGSGRDRPCRVGARLLVLAVIGLAGPVPGWWLRLPLIVASRAGPGALILITLSVSVWGRCLSRGLGGVPPP